MLKRHSLNIEHWLKSKLVWHVHKQSMKLKRLYLNNDCNYKGNFCRVIRWKFLFSGGGGENLVGESTGGIFSAVRKFSANGGLPQSPNMEWQSNILGKKCLHFLDEFTQEWSKECSFLIEVYPPFIIFGCCPYFLDKYLMLLSLVIHLFFVFLSGAPTSVCLSVGHHISGIICHVISIFGTHVENDDISMGFFHFLEILIF